MRGDALASGQRSAQFSVAPGLKFNEGEMRDDLAKMTSDDFIAKYMITRREYDLYLASSDEEDVSTFAEEMKARAEIYNKELERDTKQEASLNRECFLTPFVPVGITGRVIVSRDRPPGKPSALALPKSLRKDKTLLPTTGHVIKETLDTLDGTGFPKESLLGKRILFSPMSGTAICFKGFPTWIQLDLNEILAIVDKEDVDLEEETLEPMV
jgi:hypothetical protein